MRLIGPPANQGGGLGFLSRHFASLTGRKGLVDNDLIGVFANPRLGRFFSDEAPKKKSMFFFCIKALFSFFFFKWWISESDWFVVWIADYEN